MRTLVTVAHSATIPLAMLVPTLPRVDPDALGNEADGLYGAHKQQCEQDINEVSEDREKDIKGALAETIMWDHFPRNWYCPVLSANIDSYMAAVNNQLEESETALVEYGGAWYMAACRLVIVPVGIYKDAQRMDSCAELEIDPYIANPRHRVVATTPIELVCVNMIVARKYFGENQTEKA